MNNKKTAPLMNEDIHLKQDMKEIPHFIRYDEGLKEFIQNFFVGDVTITPIDQFWEFYIKNTQNDMRFPAISFYPISYHLNATQNNFASVQLGATIEKAAVIKDEATNEKQGTTRLLSKTARSLMFDIQYQIAIWALKRTDALQLTQEIMFPLFQHHEFPIKYFDDEYMVSYQMDPNIDDRSAVGNNSNQGTMYLYTFNLTITAPIFDSKNYYNAINKEIKLFTKIGDVEEETIIK